VERSNAWVTVTWSSTNAVSATVSGPELSSGQVSGSARVCPGVRTGRTGCELGAPVTYTITARNAAGETASSTVTVSPI
jgi:hypothetical protein